MLRCVWCKVFHNIIIILYFKIECKKKTFFITESLISWLQYTSALNVNLILDCFSIPLQIVPIVQFEFEFHLQFDIVSSRKIPNVISSKLVINGYISWMQIAVSYRLLVRCKSCLQALSLLQTVIATNILRSQIQGTLQLQWEKIMSHYSTIRN